MRNYCIGLLSALSLIVAVFSGCVPISPESTITVSGVDLKFDENIKNEYKESGRYEPRNVIATRMQILDNFVFLAMPRWRMGVPYTLGVASLDERHTPAIRPFPKLELQKEGHCNALQSVVDVVIDLQNILWVLDTGLVNTHDEQPIRRCPPKIVAIDTQSEEFVQFINLRTLVHSNSVLQYLEVDYAYDGRVFLYISDSSNRAIIVYDVINQRGHRVDLPKSVNLGSHDNDVLYINLVKKSTKNPILYFTYLGSSRVFRMEAESLRERQSKNIISGVGPKSHKIMFLGTDNGHSLFFRKTGESNIYKWNTDTAFNSNNFEFVQNGDNCRLPTHVTAGQEKVWSLESNFLDYLNNTLPCSGASMTIHPLVKSCPY